MEPDKKIVVYGRSLGSGLAAHLAAQSPTDGLILETPYYSGSELAKVMFCLGAVFLVRYPLPAKRVDFKNQRADVLHSWNSR